MIFGRGLRLPWTGRPQVVRMLSAVVPVPKPFRCGCAGRWPPLHVWPCWSAWGGSYSAVKTVLQMLLSWQTMVSGRQTWLQADWLRLLSAIMPIRRRGMLRAWRSGVWLLPMAGPIRRCHMLKTWRLKMSARKETEPFPQGSVVKIVAALLSGILPFVMKRLEVMAEGFWLMPGVLLTKHQAFPCLSMVPGLPRLGLLQAIAERRYVLSICIRMQLVVMMSC